MYWRKNYSAAARELEDFFGLSPSVREGRGIGLTEDGAKLASSVEAGFQILSSGAEALLRDNEARPLKAAAC